ncbi:uncharacterized protein LOC132295782 [Cornus florida]|uniref:uncharacterized protein LOC132295782 n=1 Tax=Cornus florida TaxID=4283 RepID=UPI0028996B27|nr:uncharacterized protein LOC132295782 [Cornus florida]
MAQSIRREALWIVLLVFIAMAVAASSESDGGSESSGGSKKDSPSPPKNNDDGQHGNGNNNDGQHGNNDGNNGDGQSGNNDGNNGEKGGGSKKDSPPTPPKNDNGGESRKSPPPPNRTPPPENDDGSESRKSPPPPKRTPPPTPTYPPPVSSSPPPSPPAPKPTVPPPNTTPPPSPSPPTSTPPSSSSPSPPPFSPSPSPPPSTTPSSPPPQTPSPTPPTPTPPSSTPQTPPPSTPTPPSSPPTPTPSPTPPTPSPPTPTPSPPSSNSPPPSPKKVKCKNKYYPKCYDMEHACPNSCPGGCLVDCVSCKPVCKCDMPGAVCQDPRFIGGDGLTFYFHGKKDLDFCLLSDSNLHINAHFIGRRNQNMRRDFTWVQSIGVLFDNHKLFIGAQKPATWDDNVDHLALAFDGEQIVLPQAEGAKWRSEATPTVSITRVSDTNTVIVEVEGNFKITTKVVPITEEESRVHNYGITSDDCFAHLDLSFKFLSLSDEVNGVLGQTYRRDYVSRVKVNVPMPLMGGGRKFASSSLFAADCAVARFDGGYNSRQGVSSEHIELPSLSCGSGMDGRGVVCKR